MKKYICTFLALSMCICALSGCQKGGTVTEAVEKNATSVEDRLSKLEVTVGDLYNEGIATEDMKDSVADLQNDLKEAKDMLENSKKSEHDEQISTALLDITQKTDELESKVQEALGGVGDVAKFADNMVKTTDEIGKSIDSAIKAGTMNSEKLAEFKKWQEELKTIANSPENTTENKAKLLKIKDELSVLASEAGASAEAMDKITSADEGTKAVVADVNDVAGLVDAYTALQNRASQEVEKGTITEEQYTNILQLGVKVSELNEKAKKDANSQEVQSQLKDLTKQVTEMAAAIK